WVHCSGAALTVRGALQLQRPAAAGRKAVLEVETTSFTVSHEPFHRRCGTHHTRERGHERHGRREVRVMSFEPQVVLGDTTAYELTMLARPLKRRTLVHWC